MAASATFALKVAVWFRRGRLFMVSPDSLGTACPLSGRNSTYRSVQISETSSKDGCHIASMGGTWMMLTYGFGGMRDDDGTLSFWPRRPPEENAVLRFPVTYRGQLLEVEIGLEKVEYTLREGERLVIRHETEEVELTRENPVAVRPVGKWGGS